jgi:hypothetical protein
MGIFSRLFGKKPLEIKIPESWIKAADEQEARGLPTIEVIGPVGYEITINESGQRGILCRRCRMTSYSIGDIDHLYCANCKTFHARRKF